MKCSHSNTFGSTVSRTRGVQLRSVRVRLQPDVSIPLIGWWLCRRKCFGDRLERCRTPRDLQRTTASECAFRRFQKQPSNLARSPNCRARYSLERDSWLRKPFASCIREPRTRRSYSHPAKLQCSKRVSVCRQGGPQRISSGTHVWPSFSWAIFPIPGNGKCTA